MKKLAAFALACVLALSLPTALPPIGGLSNAQMNIAEAAKLQTCESHAHMTAASSVQRAFSFKQGTELTLKITTSRRLTLSTPCDDALWESSATHIVSVSKQGMIKTKRPGVAVITARNVHSGQLATCTIKTYKKRTQAQVRRALLVLKKTYRPGRRWTNEQHYFWQAKQCHCYGCIAFAGIASDTAFGKYAPLKRHASFTRIKVGDHVRIGGKHSVIVLQKKRDTIIVAEGNYAGTLRWGRAISRDSLVQSGFSVDTRY